jgi:hypothetical protein
MTMTDPPAGRTRPEFVTLIAIYQFATAAILLLLACLVTAMGIPLLFFMIADPGTIAVGFLWIAVLALAVGYGVASVVVGWGLLKMREWARLGALVLAAFALIGFPIWTIVAILILVYLTSDEARQAFQQEGAAAVDEFPTAAAYKTEPVMHEPTSPTEETREIRYTESERPGNGAPSTTPATEETRRIDTPIEMPPGEPLDEPTSPLEEEQGPTEAISDTEPKMPLEPSTSEPEAPTEEEPRTAWHWQEPPRSSEPPVEDAEAGEEHHSGESETGDRQEDDSDPATEPAPEQDTVDDDHTDDERDDRRNVDS